MQPIFYKRQFFSACLVLFIILAFYITSITSLFTIRPEQDSVEALIAHTNSYDFDLLQTIKQTLSVYFINSLVQASLSASLILCLGYILAVQLKYLSPKWQNFILSTTNSTFSLPTIIVIYAIISVLGQAGWYNSWLMKFGFDAYKVNIYGLFGIVLANVFFNLGYSTTAIYNSLQKIPLNSIVLSKQFNFSFWQNFKIVQWPYLKSTIINLWLLMFFICFNAFALVYFFGGSPKYANFEVAIYNSLLSENNPQKTSIIAVVQIAFSLVIILVFSLYKKADIKNSSVKQTDNPIQLQYISYLHSLVHNYKFVKIRAYILAIFALLFIVVPILSLLIPGAWDFIKSIHCQLSVQCAELNNKQNIYAYDWQALSNALGYSLMFSIGATVVSIWISILLLRGWRWAYRFEKILNNLSLISLSIPNMLLGAGVFILLNYKLDIQANNSTLILLVIFITSINSIAYAINYLEPAYKQISNYNKIALNLGLSSWQCFKIYELALLKKSLIYAGINIFIISLGDFSIILFFVSDGLTSITYLLNQQLNSINNTSGYITAFILVTLIFILRFIVYSINFNYQINNKN